jgi:hypothetical protein
VTDRETAPALLGAALDRIAFGLSSTRSLDPVALAARAENEIALCGTPDGRRLVELLG